jgi:quercetin dioxygenase-like cupin family protein
MESGPGARRRILCHDKSLMMVEFRFDKGGEGLPHNHPHVQTTYVASGRFRFTVGEETRVLEPGDAMLVPSDAVHSCVCLEQGVLFDAFAPRRDDFLLAHGLSVS